MLRLHVFLNQDTHLLRLTLLVLFLRRVPLDEIANRFLQLFRLFCKRFGAFVINTVNVEDSLIKTYEVPELVRLSLDSFLQTICHVIFKEHPGLLALEKVLAFDKGELHNS